MSTDYALHPQPGCMDDSDPHSLPYEIALQKILETITSVDGSEILPLKAARCRVLSQDQTAPMNVPPWPCSAMDGYAISSKDIPSEGTRTLQLIGSAFAGKPFKYTVQTGQCVRVMTGAVIPAGADTVIMQEQIEARGKAITIDARAVKGDHIRATGEDCREGDIVLKAGTLLSPAALGVLASVGIHEVEVYRRLRVAVFMTGDELRRPGEALESGQIYDSNHQTVTGMLSALGVEKVDLGIVRDDPAEIEAALRSVADTVDAIITSGGVSVGEADLIRQAVEKLGTINFWKVAMKPGRPLAFGKVGKAWFFGLPGNPVSTMATFYLFVQPALKKLMGQHPALPVTFRATCVSNLKKRPGRMEFQRGILARNQIGEAIVSKTGAQGSAILSSMAQANCFIVLPVENDGVIAGDPVEVLPFYGLV